MRLVYVTFSAKSQRVGYLVYLQLYILRLDYCNLIFLILNDILVTGVFDESANRLI